jgi:hypothetical protein
MSMKAPQVHAKDYLVDMILDGRLEEATTAGILESEEHDASRKVGDTTLLNYLVKLEEYLDDHDIYAFDGWESAEFVQKPKVEKFWVTFWLRVGKDCELEGINRITNSKEAQNKVAVQKYDDGTTLVQIQVLKRYLDAIEGRNKQKSDELSDEELGRSE